MGVRANGIGIRTLAAAALAIAASACATRSSPGVVGPGEEPAGEKSSETPAPQPVQGVPGAVIEPRGDEPTSEALPAGEDDLVRGRSTVRVDAPIEAVRQAVFDYGKYAEFMPHYSASRVLGRKQDGTAEVYMQVAALGGLVKMGARIEMPGKPRDEGGYEVYEGKFIDGNVEMFLPIWRLKSVGEGQTLLSLEVFLLPKIPLPTSVLNDENTSGAVKGVMAMKRRIEG